MVMKRRPLLLSAEMYAAAESEIFIIEHVLIIHHCSCKNRINMRQNTLTSHTIISTVQMKTRPQICECDCDWCHPVSVCQCM